MQENPQAKTDLVAHKAQPLTDKNLLHRYWLVWNDHNQHSAEWLLGKDGSLTAYEQEQTWRGVWSYIPNLNVIRIEWENNSREAWNLSVEQRSQGHRLILKPYGQEQAEANSYELIDEQSLPRFYRKIADNQGLAALYRSLNEASQNQQMQEEISLRHSVENGRLWLGLVLALGFIFGIYGLGIGLFFLLVEWLASWLMLANKIEQQRQALHFVANQRWDLPSVAELQKRFLRERWADIAPNSLLKISMWSAALLWIWLEWF